MKSPLLNFYNAYGFDAGNVENLVIGKIYTALKLKNGKIGVCSNLHAGIDYPDFNIFPDFTKLSHNIIYNAYINALLNYDEKCSPNSDIFDVVDFRQYNNIVMIGYFKPLVEKLGPLNIRIKIFDLFAEEERILPVERQAEVLPEADALILSATTLSNNTFFDIIEMTKKDCRVFLLGPSAPLSKEFFKLGKIKAVFGMQFDLYDDKVLETIGNGNGTRTFSKLGRKVALIDN